jgi:hypothetical protein
VPDCWVYDLDGVLIDSRAAVEGAYLEVGVIMPDGAWGKPWHEWLPQLLGSHVEARIVHKRKTDIYPGMIQLLGHELPLAHEARMRMARNEHVYVLTGASMRCMKAALRVCELQHATILGFGCEIATKVAALDQLSQHHAHGVYYDDQPGVTVPDGWEHILWTP